MLFEANSTLETEILPFLKAGATRTGEGAAAP
jgi:hypothetical protein